LEEEQLVSDMYHSASRLFQQWGIDKVLEPLAAEPTFIAVHRYSDGKVLALQQDFDKKIRAKYGAPFLDLHRVDLQKTLAQRAKDLGVKLRLNSKVTSVDFEKSTLHLDDGATYEADLLVGADGLWSKCRAHFLKQSGKEDAPLPTGDLAYRIVLNLEDLEDPELRQWVSKPACHFWIGPGAHVVAYSVRGGKQYNIVLLVPDNLPADVSRSSGDISEMREIFTQWDPILNRFLDNVKTVDKWKLMHRPELDSWVSKKSNFVFLGDSW
jgi:salicylate hydroxylase